VRDTGVNANDNIQRDFKGTVREGVNWTNAAGGRGEWPILLNLRATLNVEHFLSNWTIIVFIVGECTLFFLFTFFFINFPIYLQSVYIHASCCVSNKYV
jgi:hypothetical protein